MADRPYPMTRDEYESLHGGCICHTLRMPPCHFCVDMPSDEEDEEARALEAASEKKADIWDAVVSIAGGKQ